jgi:hypothetical protein
VTVVVALSSHSRDKWHEALLKDVEFQHLSHVTDNNYGVRPRADDPQFAIVKYELVSVCGESY